MCFEIDNISKLAWPWWDRPVDIIELSQARCLGYRLRSNQSESLLASFVGHLIRPYTLIYSLFFYTLDSWPKMQHKGKLCDIQIALSILVRNEVVCIRFWAEIVSIFMAIRYTPSTMKQRTNPFIAIGFVHQSRSDFVGVATVPLIRWWSQNFKYDMMLRKQFLVV